MSLNTLINIQKIEFDLFYKKFLLSKLSKDHLSKAMIYGSMNGGKRIRPFLVSIFAKFAKVKKYQYLRLSAAIESIHCYSLIHDDLPSMDNDDFRRGKLSTHKKFDEATAILAGDALHDLAFEIIADKSIHTNSNIRILLIKELSEAIGFKGLAGGQSLDLLFENKKIKVSKIIEMYNMKTAALFSFCCVSVFILGERTKKEINFAREFGNLFGLIFQITDDLIDNENNFKILGKTPGKDLKQGKSTLISIFDKSKLKLFCLKEIMKMQIKNKNILQKNKIFNELIYLNIDELN